MEVVLGALLVLTIVAIAVLVVVHLRYKDVHPYTSRDIAAARDDAAAGSRATSRGQALQHLAPWFPDFGYNPSDCRFLGSPIDLVVFDGLREGDLRRIVFVEIKSGSSDLSKPQREIKRAADQGQVEFETYRVPTPPSSTPRQPSATPRDGSRIRAIEPAEIPPRVRRRLGL